MGIIVVWLSNHVSYENSLMGSEKLLRTSINDLALASYRWLTRIPLDNCCQCNWKTISLYDLSSIYLVIMKDIWLFICIYRSVNFKFVPEPIFVSRGFALFLLAAHLILLAIFAHYRWCRHEGGLSSLIHSRLVQLKLRTAYLSSFSLRQFNNCSTVMALKTEHIVTTMFVGNFIGIVCARSLHYQFYSWYFYSLPYLLWRTTFPTWLRLILFMAVEFCWNIYPSNVYSSLLLLCVHLTILGGLWKASPEYPYLANAKHRLANLENKASWKIQV